MLLESQYGLPAGRTMGACGFWKPSSLPMKERLSESEAIQNKAKSKTGYRSKKYVSPTPASHEPLRVCLFFF